MKSKLLDRIKKGEKKESTVQKSMKSVQKRELPDFNFGLDEILQFRKQIVGPKDNELKKEILEETYQAKFTVYSGRNKMYQNLKNLYWWESMRKEIAQFV